MPLARPFGRCLLRPCSKSGNSQIIPSNGFISILLAQHLARISSASWIPSQSVFKLWKCRQLLLPESMQFSKHCLPHMDYQRKPFQTTDNNLQPISLSAFVNIMEPRISEVLHTNLAWMEWTSCPKTEEFKVLTSRFVWWTQFGILSWQHPAVVSHYTTSSII